MEKMNQKDVNVNGLFAQYSKYLHQHLHRRRPLSNICRGRVTFPALLGNSAVGSAGKAQTSSPPWSPSPISKLAVVVVTLGRGQNPQIVESFHGSHMSALSFVSLMQVRGTAWESLNRQVTTPYHPVVPINHLQETKFRPFQASQQAKERYIQSALLVITSK